MTAIKSKFITSLKTTHPGLSQQSLETLIHENLICPSAIHLPSELFGQAEDLVQQLYKLRRLGQENQNLLSPAPKNLFDPGHHSICMSYDVHYDPTKKKLQLIEINTNASFMFLSYHLYAAHGMDLPNFPSLLRQSFANEKKLWSSAWKKDPSEIKRLAIVDENPTEQRLYVEFLVAQEFFKSWGWDVSILDQKDIREGFDFIYNRTTDFYFDQPTTQTLLQLWNDKKSCLSPHPTEYYYLADKQRLIDWYQEAFQAQIQKDSDLSRAFKDYVPFCFSMNDRPSEQVWAERKKYFFKPKNAYGSKQAYSGESISRKMFESLNSKDFIVQEKIPAPEISLETATGKQNFKYDLRLYAYQGQLQNIVARAYQGQLTNLRTPSGGFAPVKFG